jgi:hypothetical protein
MQWQESSTSAMWRNGNVYNMYECQIERVAKEISLKTVQSL